MSFAEIKLESETLVYGLNFSCFHVIIDCRSGLVFRASASWAEGRDRPKSLKLIVVALTLGPQDYGNGTTTGPPVSR